MVVYEFFEDQPSLDLEKHVFGTALVQATLDVPTEDDKRLRIARQDSIQKGQIIWLPRYIMRDNEATSDLYMDREKIATLVYKLGSRLTDVMVERPDGGTGYLCVSVPFAPAVITAHEFALAA